MDLAIIYIDLNSPENAGSHRHPPVEKDGLPALQRLSDLTWLPWAARASNPKNLRYFLVVSMVNTETQQTIRRAITSEQLNPWPGHYFSTFPDSTADNAKALIGELLTTLHLQSEFKPSLY